MWSLPLPTLLSIIWNSHPASFFQLRIADWNGSTPEPLSLQSNSKSAHLKAICSSNLYQLGFILLSVTDAEWNERMETNFRGSFLGLLLVHRVISSIWRKKAFVYFQTKYTPFDFIVAFDVVEVKFNFLINNLPVSWTGVPKSYLFLKTNYT